MASPAERGSHSLIELTSNRGMRAELNTTGAYLERLATADGSELLFPRQITAAGKDRGGIPVCAPIFGPGGEVGLNQHGFARNLTWQTVETSSDSVTLSLERPDLQDSQIPPAYHGAAMELSVTLISEDEAQGAELHLKVMNDGQEPFVESSGFHPYFLVASNLEADEYAIRFSDNNPTRFTADELAAVQRVGGKHDEIVIHGANGTWQLMTQNLPQVIAWSDQPKDYFCIEPTAAGPLNEDPIATERLLLQPGESREYSMRLLWRQG